MLRTLFVYKWATRTRSSNHNIILKSELVERVQQSWKALSIQTLPLMLYYMVAGGVGAAPIWRLPY